MKIKQIAGSLELWNEYFNTDALMTDSDFYEMPLEERIEMLENAFGADAEQDDE